MVGEQAKVVVHNLAVVLDWEVNSLVGVEGTVEGHSLVEEPVKVEDHSSAEEKDLEVDHSSAERMVLGVIHSWTEMTMMENHNWIVDQRLELEIHN